MIQEIISGHVSQMTANGDSFSFIHGETSFQNMLGDEATLPAVFLDMPVKYQPIQTASGAIKKTYVCVCLFLYKSNLDDGTAQRYVSEQKAEAAQVEFMLRIQNDTDNIESFSVGECYQVLNLFDANFDGVVMPFSVVLRNVESKCF